MFKPGIKCTIISKNAATNGKVAKVVRYANSKSGKYVIVECGDKRFCISENNLRKTTKYDLIRNMSDDELNKFINTKGVRK